MSINIDQILNELSYRVGKVNLKNEIHLKELINLLSENNISRDDIISITRNIIFLNEITEDEKQPQDKVKIYIEPGEKPPKGRKILKGPRGGYYFYGTPQEKNDKKNKKPVNKKPVNIFNKPAVKKPNVINKPVKPVVKKEIDPITKSTSFLSKLDDKYLKSKLKNISPQNIKIVNDLTSNLNKFLNSKNDSEKRKLAQQISDTHKLWVNKDPNLYDKNKLYVGSVPGSDRKILGNSNSSILNTISKELMKYGANLLPQKDPLKDVKNQFQGASKPTFTEVHHAKKDNNVSEVFKDKMFEGIDSKYHSVFGPKDKMGSLLWPPDKNSKEYFKFSIDNNKALDNTIEAARKAALDKKVSKEFYSALVKHKERMTNILNKTKVPSDEARQAVLDSYGQLATSLYTEDSELAGSIMKNFAENALYESEIAGGENVLLPAHGSFPSADKIKLNIKTGTKVERVSGVSVKFGKSGLTYGMPAETKQYQKFHPDPAKRDIMENRVGLDGYELGIKNEWVKDKKKFDELYGNSGLDILLPKGFNNKLHAASQKMLSHIESLKQKSGYSTTKKPPKDKIMVIKDEIEKLNKSLGAELAKEINIEQLSGKIGKDNAKLFSGGVLEMVNIIGFSNILRTSGGLDKIEHNHQNYEDGKLVFHTESGSSDIGLWNLLWRPYGDRAGGLDAGFNAERKSKLNLK